MPHHANWLTLVLAYLKETLAHNTDIIGESFLGHQHPTWASFEPFAAALLVALLVLVLALRTRARLAKSEEAVIPEDKLTLRTFLEVFLGYFYDLAKSVMGPERAKKYFPVVGAASLFVFFANTMGLLPGVPVPTSNLNITAGCALVVFVLFNLYGLKVNGYHYILHFAGPKWYLAPLIFPIELISLFVRPVTLSVRLMVNMVGDHLLAGVFLGLIPLIIPLPVMFLGVLVIAIQTLVFALLSSIYIALATEHLDH